VTIETKIDLEYSGRLKEVDPSGTHYFNHLIAETARAVNAIIDHLNATSNSQEKNTSTSDKADEVFDKYKVQEIHCPSCGTDIDVYVAESNQLIVLGALKGTRSERNR